MLSKAFKSELIAELRSEASGLFDELAFVAPNRLDSYEMGLINVCYLYRARKVYLIDSVTRVTHPFDLSECGIVGHLLQSLLQNRFHLAGAISHWLIKPRKYN